MTKWSKVTVQRCCLFIALVVSTDKVW